MAGRSRSAGTTRQGRATISGRSVCHRGNVDLSIGPCEVTDTPNEAPCKGQRLQLDSRPIRSASVVTVDTDQDEFLTVADIANRLKLNQQTIYNWIQSRIQD
jgi:hypothetical protein